MKINGLAPVAATASLAWLLVGTVGCSGAPAEGQTATSGADLDEAAFLAGEYVATPYGYVHSSCVIEVDDDTEVHPDGTLVAGAMTTKLTPCAHKRFTAEDAKAARASATGHATGGEIDGWTVDGSWKAPSGITRMTGDFVVPAAPRSPDGLTYLFPGLEPTGRDVILQPVLQYGPGGGAGGGNYWAMASWDCCPVDNVVHGPLVKVKSGDRLYGDMRATSACDADGVCSTWEIITEDTAGKTFSRLKASGVTEAWDWAFGGVLEAYSITSCDQLPSAGETFYDLALYGTENTLLTPTWTSDALTPGGPSCNFAMTSGDPTKVKLAF